MFDWCSNRGNCTFFCQDNKRQSECGDLVLDLLAASYRMWARQRVLPAHGADLSALGVTINLRRFGPAPTAPIKHSAETGEPPRNLATSNSARSVCLEKSRSSAGMRKATFHRWHRI